MEKTVKVFGSKWIMRKITKVSRKNSESPKISKSLIVKDSLQIDLKFISQIFWPSSFFQLGDLISFGLSYQVNFATRRQMYWRVKSAKERKKSVLSHKNDNPPYPSVLFTRILKDPINPIQLIAFADGSLAHLGMVFSNRVPVMYLIIKINVELLDRNLWRQ